MEPKKHSDRKQFRFYAAYVYTLTTVVLGAYHSVEGIKLIDKKNR